MQPKHFKEGDRVVALSTSPWWFVGAEGRVTSVISIRNEMQVWFPESVIGGPFWDCGYPFKMLDMNMGED